jgi:hypothetical protein
MAPPNPPEQLELVRVRSAHLTSYGQSMVTDPSLLFVNRMVCLSV